MKTISRSDLNSTYQTLIQGENFPSDYIAHGIHTECNFGGLLITLSNDGEACIIVRDWAGDQVSISEVLEIEYREPEEPTEPDQESEPGFELDGQFYSLGNFMRI